MKAAAWFGQTKTRWLDVNRWQKATVYLVAVFVLYIILSLSLVPWLIKQQLEKQLSAISGHPVSVQQVAYHPLKLSLTLRQLAIRDIAPEQHQDLFSFDRLYVDFTLSSLFYWSWNFEKLELDGLFFHLSRLKDGSINTDSLFPSDGQAAPVDSNDDQEASVPRLRIGLFVLRDAQFKVSDYLPEDAVDFTISNIDFSLSDFYTQKTGEAANGYSIDAQVGEQGRLSWSGNVDLPASLISGNIALEQFPLPNAFAFMRPYTDLRITQGAVTFSSNYLIDFKEQFQFSTDQGHLSISDFEVQAMQQTRSEFVLLGLDNIAFDLQQQILNLGDISLSDGMFSAAFDEHSQLNWASWFHFEKLLAETQNTEQSTNQPAQAGAVADSAEASSPPWVIALNGFSGKQFDLLLNESWLGQKKTHPLTLDSLQISGFSSDMQQTTALSLQAQLYQASPVRSELTFNGPEQRLQGTVSLDNLALSQLKKWYDPFVQLQINSGQLALSSQLAMHFVDDAFQLSSEQGVLQLSELSLVAPEQAEQPAWLEAKQLKAEGIRFELAKQDLSIASISSEGLALIASVDEAGKLDVIEQLQLAASDASMGAEQPLPDSTAAAIETAVELPKDKISAEPLAPSQELEASWQVSIDALKASNSSFSLSEPFSGERLNHQLSAPLITVNNIESSLSAPINIALNLQAQQGGEVSIEGELAIAQHKAELALVVEQLGLAFYQPYLARYTELKMESADFSTEQQLQLNWQQGFDIAMRGPLSIEQLHLKDARAQSDLLKWSEFNLSQLDLDTAKQRLVLGDLNFIQPYFLIQISEDFSTNLAGIVKSSTESESESETEVVDSDAPKPSAKPWQVSIASTQFSQGLVDFADYSLSPNFTAKIEKVEGKIGTLSQDPTQPAKVSLSGEVDGYAPVKFAGEVAPLAPQPAFDAALDFKHLELTRLNAYSGTYAGYVIERGQMSLALAYKLNQNQLQGSNNVYIEQLQLGKRTDSDKATSLPVELAIALLEDDQGVIDLGLEVSGDVNDPDFNVAGLVFKALGGALKKIITSPFALIGSLIGSEETLNEVSFVAGSSELGDEQLKQLSTLAVALQKRPQLKLSLLGSVEPSQDIPALKRQQLATTLIANSGLDMPVQSVDLSAVLDNRSLRTALVNLAQQQLEQASRDIDKQQITLKLTEQEALSPQQLNLDLHSLWYQRLVDTIELAEGDVASLAEQRAVSVKDALTEQYGLSIDRAFVERQALEKQADKMLVTISVIAE
ncbi:DUF748 domain-containing protein [Agarivorans sp. TSD2052]|uniref:DUF748 domain-containing protein n=1 Tax=Agarivorans sp. TSD2052 TaxID=2937286 RepID=UPI00200F651C|nr:DUF748 domain-containing protein [Agarivorans sp. TSD2052]UPW19611.1 DUF748 domain-containing protein [Agarivorans sp. TSD2052]